MSRNAIVVLAIVLVVGSSGLSRSAFAHGGGGGGGDSFRGNRLSGDGHVGYANRGSGLHVKFRGYEGRDIWGHWGAYYGPMIP
jgi:hypothetical protein